MRYRAALVVALFSFAVGWAIIGAKGEEARLPEIPIPEPFPNLSNSGVSSAASEKVNDRYAPDNQQEKARHNTAVPAQRSKLLREDIPLDDMGDPKQLIFQGVALFSEEQLRQALANDLKYQVAARPANDTLHFAATLTERLTEGYWSSGCQNAVVQVFPAVSRRAMIVKVEEGSRYQKGKIIVAAPDAVDKEQLVKSLTTMQKPRKWRVEYDHELPKVDDDYIAWKASEDVDYTRGGLESLRSATQWALVEQGFPYATFRLDREKHAGSDVADLVIRVTGEGDRFNAALVQKLEAKLRHSCRYWTMDIASKFAKSSGERSATSNEGATLLLKLHEYDPMPPIDEPLAEADEILRKAAESFTGNGNTPPAEIAFTGTWKSVGGLPKEMQVVRAAFSVRRGLALDLKLPDSFPLSIDHSLIITSHEIEIFDWRLRQKFAMPVQRGLNLQMAHHQGFNDSGKYDQNLSLGCAVNTYGGTVSPEDYAWKMSIEPIALVHMAHEPGAQTRIHDGRLTLSFGDGSKSEGDFDAKTGRILCLRLLGGENSNKWSANVDFEPGKFDDMTSAIQNRGHEIVDSCDSKHAIESVVNFALAEMNAQPSVQTNSKLRGVCDLARFAQTLPCCRGLFKALDVLLAEANLGGDKSKVVNSRPFKIPGAQTKDDDEWTGFSRNILHLVPRMADEAFPRGSWPWVAARELTCAQLLDEIDESHERTVELVGKEFAKMAVRKDNGPVGTLLFISGLQTTGKATTEFGAGLAAASLRDLSDDAFTRDIQLITEGHHGLALISRQAAESFGKLPADEQRRLIMAMPGRWQDPLDRLAARRKNMLNEPVTESIKVVLLDSWHHGLREKVAADLQGKAANGARQWLDSTETALKDSPTKSQ
jgi:hypothetical protein